MMNFVRLCFFKIRNWSRSRVLISFLLLLMLSVPIVSGAYYVVNLEGSSFRHATLTNQAQYENYAALAQTTEEQLMLDGDDETLLSDLVSNRTQMIYFQLLEEKGLTDNEHYFMNWVCEYLAEFRAKQYVAEKFPNSDVALETQDPSFVEMAETYETIYHDEDYAAYMKAYERQIRSSAELNEIQRDIELTVRRYRLAADLHGENTGAELDELLDVIRRYEYAKQLGYDPSSQTVIPLSADELQQLSREATIAEYRLSNGYVSLSEEDATCSALADLMHNITRYFILVIMVYLGARWIAGAWRAARLSFSLTMPQRRSCQFFAQILTMTLLGVLIALLTYGWEILWSFLFYGKSGQDAFFSLTASGGVYRISGVWYGLLNVLFDYAWIWIFTLFASVLSVMTRNLIASFVLPIGLYVASSVHMLSASVALPQMLYKYLPGTHFDLSYVLGTAWTQDDLSPWFCFAYMLLWAFILLWISYDSFTRRDF